MKIRVLFLLLGGLLLSGCTDTVNTEDTSILLQKMDSLRLRGTMMGMQIPTEYGLSGGQRWEDDGSIRHSDIEILTGSHPAVCGWDISEIELDHPRNIDGEEWNVIRRHIRAAYERGALNTLSWHCANPVTGGNSWDNTPAAHTLIPGGEHHGLFCLWLDKVAAFLQSLTTPSGKLIPLIFRPWHEHTGNGFWWGKGSATREEYVALYRFTFDYLRQEKGLTNLLSAYSPDAIHFIWDPEERHRDIYLEYWPGDEYVDIVGLDAYDAPGRRFDEVVPSLTSMISEIAKEKKKIAALTEVGLENNSPEHSPYFRKNWWTEQLYPVIQGRGLSFVLCWRNGGLPPSSHYFGPWKGCYSETDFILFASQADILLERDLPTLYFQ
ncbi:MAG: beta-mannosidase [Bacteroidales bacterium]|nr:beta-mannosidase [Bacteroidales bacterium]